MTFWRRCRIEIFSKKVNVGLWRRVKVFPKSVILTMFLLPTVWLNTDKNISNSYQWFLSSSKQKQLYTTKCCCIMNSMDLGYLILCILCEVNILIIQLWGRVILEHGQGGETSKLMRPPAVLVYNFQYFLLFRITVLKESYNYSCYNNFYSQHLPFSLMWWCRNGHMRYNLSNDHW